MRSLPDIAREGRVTERQIRHWQSLGLVDPIWIPERRRWMLENDEAEWALELSRLVRAGVAVEALATMHRDGTIATSLERLARAARKAARAHEDRVIVQMRSAVPAS